MKKLPPRSAQYHRDQIAQLPLVAELTRIMSILAIGYAPEYAAPPQHATMSEVTANKPPIIGWLPVTKDDLARYTLLLKTTEALLRKVLPDLKSVEITDQTEAKRTFSDQELAQRISGVLGQVRKQTQTQVELEPNMVPGPPSLN